mgnify:CR=1 FL=1
MGDGINDSPALTNSDVGISVDTAVDIAKETADIILLEKDLNVLLDGVMERKKNICKFNEIYKWLERATIKHNNKIDVFTNSDLLICNGKFLNPDITKMPDYVIFWDKDIVLAKQLENMGLKLFNSSRAIEICDNKALTYVELNGKIEMPDTIKSWGRRLWCEYMTMYKISKSLSPVYLWFSLHDTTPRVIAERQAVYCQTSFPFLNIKNVGNECTPYLIASSTSSSVSTCPM